MPNYYNSPGLSEEELRPNVNQSADHVFNTDAFDIGSQECRDEAKGLSGPCSKRCT